MKSLSREIFMPVHTPKSPLPALRFRARDKVHSQRNSALCYVFFVDAEFGICSTFVFSSDRISALVILFGYYEKG